MTDRVQRLLAVWGGLCDYALLLADSGITPMRTLSFLDLMARCEAFDRAEAEEAGVADLLRQATESREAGREQFVDHACRAVERMCAMETGCAFVESFSPVRDRPVDEPGVIHWAEDLLAAANAAPFLPEPVRRRIAEDVEHAAALVEANPEVFLEASSMARDRLAIESPRAIPGALGMPLLDALAHAPQLARADDAFEESGRGASPGAHALWERLVGRRQDMAGAPPPAGWPAEQPLVARDGGAPAAVPAVPFPTAFSPRAAVLQAAVRKPGGLGKARFPGGIEVCLFRGRSLGLRATLDRLPPGDGPVELVWMTAGAEASASFSEVVDGVWECEPGEGIVGSESVWLRRGEARWTPET